MQVGKSHANAKYRSSEAAAARCAQAVHKLWVKCEQSNYREREVRIHLKLPHDRIARLVKLFFVLPYWLGAMMRRVLTALVLATAILTGGCAIFDAEINNRGGYLDKVIDDHWFKADSKKMRVLRAFALEASLARIASVSPKNDNDRKLLALRVGDASVRAGLLYSCAFGPNPTKVSLAANDPCFYFDSLMVDYTTALFDLAMVSFPIEDTKNLLNIVIGGFSGPTGALDALNGLLNLAKEAFKYGRIIGALYRDTMELEVQVWLDSPTQDQGKVPLKYQVTPASVSRLREVYDRGNDNMVAWSAEIGALRAANLEPMPGPKHFFELSALVSYLCGLIVTPTATGASSPYKLCYSGLVFEPTTGNVVPSATGNAAKPVALLRGAGNPTLFAGAAALQTSRPKRPGRAELPPGAATAVAESSPDIMDVASLPR